MKNKWTDYNLRECVFNSMLILKVKYMPTYSEMENITIKFISDQGELKTVSGKTMYYTLKRNCGTYEEIASYFGLRTKMEQSAQINREH